MLRAQSYLLLARSLAKPPTAEVLDILRGIEGDESDYGRALSILAATARGTTVEAVADEYQTLFYGVGRSELMPYASFYLTGFLNDRPTAKLVGDMRRLGIAQAEDAKQPEDHIAALCEIMAGLITNRFDKPVDLVEQGAFFDAHVGCWAPRFFEDLEAAKSAAFYMPVGRVGRLFMDIEAEGFRMAA